MENNENKLTNEYARLKEKYFSDDWIRKIAR